MLLSCRGCPVEQPASQGGLSLKTFCDCPAELDQAKAAKLVAMLEASIQRRFPKGLKVHVHSVDRFGCLAALTRELKMAELTITRAKVKTYAINRSSGHTFYKRGADGQVLHCTYQGLRSRTGQALTLAWIRVCRLHIWPLFGSALTPSVRCTMQRLKVCLLHSALSD